MIKRERALKQSGRRLHIQSDPVRGRRSWAQFFPLLDLRVDCLLLFAPLLTTGSSGEDSSGSVRLDPPLVACFLTAGSSGDNSSGFDRLDPLLVGSFVTAGSSGDDSLDTGLFDPLLLSFLTAGVLGFLAGAPLLTGVDLDGGVDSFGLEADCFLAVLLAEDTTFLAGDFLASGRPLPLAFD